MTIGDAPLFLHGMARMECRKEKRLMNKNIAKYLSYKLAMEQLNRALEFRFPIEAISIEESVISDRLLSTLNASLQKQSVKQCDISASLGGVLSRCKGGLAFLEDEEMKMLKEIDAWRKERNRAIHGIVKSRQGEGPAVSAEVFMTHAMIWAKEGAELMQKVQNWSKRKIYAAKKACQSAQGT